MSDELIHFFGNHPFWAILIVVFMALPIMGAVLHIILKAFGRKGIDMTPAGPGKYQDGPGDDIGEHIDHNSPRARGEIGK